MSLAQHLIELRKRLFISVVALLAAMAVSFFITDWVIKIMTMPIEMVDASRGGGQDVQLMFDSVTSGFDLRLRISFAIGMILSAPIWLMQIWLYISPAMKRREVAFTLGFAGAAIPLFFAGCAVGWWLLPNIIELLSTFVPEQSTLFYQYSYYYDFVFKLILVVGIAFVIPVFLVVLNLAGVLSARSILKGWRVAVLVATLIAGITTPAVDVVSMLLLGGMLIVLYFAAALVALLFDRRKSKRESVDHGATKPVKQESK